MSSCSLYMWMINSLQVIIDNYWMTSNCVLTTRLNVLIVVQWITSWSSMSLGIERIENYTCHRNTTLKPCLINLTSHTPILRSTHSLLISSPFVRWMRNLGKQSICLILQWLVLYYMQLQSLGPTVKYRRLPIMVIGTSVLIPHVLQRASSYLASSYHSTLS
jgi:hypothetical protein